MLAASNRTTFRMPRICPSDSAFRLADLGELLVFDDLLGDVEPPLRDPLNVGELDLLGSLVPFGVRLHGVDLLLKVLLGGLELVAGQVLGLLGLLGKLLVKLLDLGFEHVEPAVHRPLPPEPDKRLVAGQHVHAVEHERHVVELEVLDLPRRSSKNCSPMKSRSAIAITLIFPAVAAALSSFFFSASFVSSSSWCLSTRQPGAAP